MTTQNDWIDYQSRTIDVQELATRAVNQANKANGTTYSPETAYEDNEWGVFESSYLYKALTQMLRQKVLWDKEKILEQLPQSQSKPIESTIFTDKGDEIELESPDVLTRPLNWFKSAAPEKAIRQEAKEMYERNLLNLYVEYVESTGETFYPELQAILENQFDFQGDS
jgi:hypothetical protein